MENSNYAETLVNDLKEIDEIFGTNNEEKVSGEQLLNTHKTN